MFNRLNTIAAGFLAGIFLLYATPSAAQTIITTQYILYKSGATPLPPRPEAAWEEPSIAYTAITIPMPFDVWKANGATISSANLQLVWKANSASANTGTGIMLCPDQPHAETGLVNCSWVTTYFAANAKGTTDPRCVSNTTGGPFPCRDDITSALQGWIQAGSPLYLVVVSYGNGSTGPLIYDAEVFIDWNVP